MKKFIMHVTSGNVFDNLGFDCEEAASLARKTDLMMELERIMKRGRFNTTIAAKRFGVEKSVIAPLKKGDLDFFTIDLLIQMLERAGKHVEVVVSDKKQNHAA